MKLRRPKLERFEREAREIEEELAALATFRAERIEPLQRQLEAIYERRRREDEESA